MDGLPLFIELVFFVLLLNFAIIFLLLLTLFIFVSNMFFYEPTKENITAIANNYKIIFAKIKNI